jgi:two-component system alkaline phosphatase synthesis response regulator PhoP
VQANGQDVTLTQKEFELLCLLMRSPGTVFSRETLLSRIWGYEFTGETRTVDVHIRTLRQKLGGAGDCIETVRGYGYKLEN